MLPIYIYIYRKQLFYIYIYIYIGSVHGVMVIMVGNRDMTTQVQILDEADCISHNSNNLGKDMNPHILPPAMGT